VLAADNNTDHAYHKKS